MSDNVAVFKVPGGRAWGSGAVVPYRLRTPSGDEFEVELFMISFQSPDEWADEYERGMEALGDSQPEPTP